MANPEYAAEWQRTKIAEYLALNVLNYRTDHSWLQREAGRRWNLPQSAIARIEAGDHQTTSGIWKSRFS